MLVTCARDICAHMVHVCLHPCVRACSLSSVTFLLLLFSLLQFAVNPERFSMEKSGNSTNSERLNDIQVRHSI